MNVPPWAWLAGAAVAVVGTGVVVGQVNSAPSGGAPPAGGGAGAGGGAPAPTQPIAITQGHRYQVTLTFTGQTMAALAANVIPNLAAGLGNVAPGEFVLVSSSAPSDTQVVYVVDATGGAAGSVTQESPQTFYADLNAAQFGGIGVDVVDQGVSPVAAGGGSLPIGGAAPPGSGASSPGSGSSSSSSSSPSSGAGLTPQTVVTDPSLIAYAQRAIAAAMPSSGVAPTGTVDAATLAAIASYQQQSMPADASGVLDYLTWGNLVAYALGAVGTAGLQTGNAILSDAPTIAFAQNALALGIGAGTFPQIDYGAAQETGVASDPAWTSALGTAMGEVAKTLAAIGITTITPPTDGTLDYPAFAILIAWSYAPPATTIAPGGAVVTVVEPATPVTLADQVTIAQKALAQIPASTGTRTAQQNAVFSAVVANGNASDPATVAAVTLVQSGFTGLVHRTTPGVLDYLTFAAIVSATVQPATPSAVTRVLSAPLVTDPATVAGAQEATAILVLSGRVPGGPWPVYTRNLVDANPETASFKAAVAALIGALNTLAFLPSKVSLPADGTLDANVFSVLFALAYL